MSAGPLVGVRVLEFAGIGPGPFAAMLLADLGADVVRIDRAGGGEWPNFPILSRGRTSIVVDLKTEGGKATCLAAIEKADVLIEGYRPGVMERLGLGPDAALARNARLIYGRVTGWGQSGPLASVAGHDINYLALAGVLATLGRASDAPLPPLNLLGDYAAGSLYLVMGILAALWERTSSQRGQVIDAAIVDGAASLMGPLLGMAALGIVDLDRARNVLGGTAAPNYRTYECADGRYVAVGPLEPRFYQLLCNQLGIEPRPSEPLDVAAWAEAAAALAPIFATRTRDDWGRRFAQSDGCVTPVLTPEEAAHHPHLSTRGTYVNAHGHWQPAVAPRFSRTPGAAPGASPADGEGGFARLAAWGVERPT